ncbi:MAG: flavin-containing monooxygenase [Acidimicrobiia bacterium]
MSTGAPNPHAGVPFYDDDDAIARYLADVSVPALMCSLVHMTGDESWLHGPERPRALTSIEFQGRMSDADQAAVRGKAVRAIAAYRDAGCVPVPLEHDTVLRMMEFLGGGPVPDDIAGLFFEELNIHTADSRAVRWGDEVPQSVRDDSPVLVIGAGESGIVTGIRLKQAGLPFTIVEKIDGPGGVWRHNRYPGARVDIGSHHYSYSFEPSDTWSEYFCRQPELQRYFEHVVDKYDLEPHCRWNTEVVAATWNEATARWDVSLRTPDGTIEPLSVRFIVSAVGALSLPYLPSLAGMESFAGPWFHSAEWPRDLDITGKRFALVGAGATGFQIAPTIAGDVEQLSIFQRTPQWMFNNPAYHAAVPEGDKWALTHLPFYGRWLRFVMMYPGIAQSTTPFKIDPSHHDDSHHTISAENERVRVRFTNWIETNLAGRPDLIEKSIPNYPPWGKRILQDNGSWLKCLLRPNVDFVNTAIDHIDAAGIVTADGVHHPADVICYATGFRAHDYLAPIEFTGRGGISIREMWRDEPSAYLGITSPQFPNLFMLYGPGTNLAFGASLFFNSECQARYTLDAIHDTLARGACSIEVRRDVHDDYMTRYRAEIDSLIWSHDSIEHTHYKNRHGKIYSLQPWPIDAYWRMTRHVDLADYVVE